MRKSMFTRGKHQVVRTTNGVETTTRPVYLKKLVDYTPLPNGFNLELAEAVFATIATKPALWDQGCWRTVLLADDLAPQYRSQMLEALNSGAKKPEECGTAMCVAGWIGEATAADWTNDFDAIRKSGYARDTVLVTKEESARMRAFFYSVSGYYQEREFFVDDKLTKRGFSVDTHVRIAVLSYALWKLGLPTDYLDMFAGSNGIVNIRACIDTYVEFGPLTMRDDRERDEARTRKVNLFDRYCDESLRYGSTQDWALTKIVAEPVV